MSKAKKEGQTVVIAKLATGQTIIRARSSFRLAGPEGTYSSTEFGYDLETIVDGDDDLLIKSTAQSLDELGDQLAEARRDPAYRELVKHIKAIESKGWRQPS